MSWKVTITSNEIINANPKLCTILSLSGETLFPPLIISINTNNILPPSKAGIGNKFIIPKLKLSIEISSIYTFIFPLIVSSEEATEPVIWLMPTGPTATGPENWGFELSLKIALTLLIDKVTNWETL